MPTNEEVFGPPLDEKLQAALINTIRYGLQLARKPEPAPTCFTVFQREDDQSYGFVPTQAWPAAQVPLSMKFGCKVRRVLTVDVGVGNWHPHGRES